MPTIAEQLITIANIKAAIHASIVAKGQAVTANPFAGYSAAIDAITTGGAYNPDFPSPIFMGLPSTGFVNGTEPTGKAWYVRPGGAGDKDGRDWDNAFATREDAILAASAGDHIRVMEGLYYISTMQIPKLGVSEFYGFTQGDGTWATRNPWLHPSRLDACYTSNRWDNDSVVFTIGQVVDGLWVQNVFGGNGITSLQAGTFRNVSTVNCTGATNGGGMYFVTGTVDSAFATKCSASYSGGIHAIGSNLTNCVITNCTSGSVCGIYATASTLTNCVITNCGATTYGTSGGIRAIGSNLTNCVITNCTAGAGPTAGGICVQDSSNVANCVVTNCATPSNNGGGGMYVTNSSTATNCVVTNCTSSGQGGGIHVQDSSTATNCTVILCSAPTGSGFWVGNKSQSLYNCCSWGCDIYLAQANHAYKIYNCASNFALTGVTNWDTVADVQNFLPLSTFPFAAAGVAPFDGSGAYYNNLANGEESLALIDRVVIPSLTNPRPHSTSPLIGAGYYEAGVTPDTDADGNERPLPPSIGAYEYVEEA